MDNLPSKYIQYIVQIYYLKLYGKLFNNANNNLKFSRTQI